jgi:hypothetical protein
MHGRRGSEVGEGKGQVCNVRGVGTDTADIEEKGAVGQYTDPGGVSRSGWGGGDGIIVCLPLEPG